MSFSWFTCAILHFHAHAGGHYAPVTAEDVVGANYEEASAAANTSASDDSEDSEDSDDWFGDKLKQIRQFKPRVA